MTLRNMQPNAGHNFSSKETFDPSFTAYMTEIDNYRPVAVLVNNHEIYGDHSISGFGYDYDPNGQNFRYMIVHDTWGSTPEDDWVQFGVGYSRIGSIPFNLPRSSWTVSRPFRRLHPWPQISSTLHST